MKALAKEPEERYATAAEFGGALEAVLQAELGEGASMSIATPIPSVAISQNNPSDPFDDQDENPSWVMLGVGVFIAVAGVIALILAFRSGS
jgi:hypothetical protein